MKKAILITAWFFCYLEFNYAQPGELDSRFGTNGIVTSDFSAGKPISTVVQSNGKILLAIGDGHVSRYNANGVEDSTFGNNGTITTDFGVVSIAIQSNDKFAVAGTTAGQVFGKKSDFVVASYKSDGTTDNTFGTNGKEITDFGSNSVDRTSSVTVQSDGKIVLSGVSSPDFELKHFRNVIVRYNIDGSLDNTFSSDGKLSTDMDGDVGEVCRNLAIQSDGKIVIARFITGNNYRDFAVARYNADGGKDNTFAGDGLKKVDLGYDDIGVAVALQSDGKIVVSGFVNYPDYTGINYSDMCVIRLNTDGSLDTSFSGDGIQITNAPINDKEDYNYALAIQNDGKILIAGYGTYALVCYNTNGSLDKTFSGDGQQRTAGTINDLAIFDNKLYAVLDYRGIARYLLADEVSPKLKITSPADGATYVRRAPIILSAEIINPDFAIKTVDFYHNNTLIFTEHKAPFYRVWYAVLPVGDVTIIAIATDINGHSITSDPVTITIIHNKPPTVKITSPTNNAAYAAPAAVLLSANAGDADGSIKTVDFYNGNTLIFTEHKAPFYRKWYNVPTGTYTITAKATDNLGLSTVSAPVTITVSDPGMVSSRPYSENEKTPQNDALSLRLSPNPAGNIVNIYTKGLQQDKQATLSIISVSGIVLKTINISSSATQLDVSSLASGVYTVKIISGEKVMYKQFVKL